MRHGMVDPASRTWTRADPSDGTCRMHGGAPLLAEALAGAGSGHPAKRLRLEAQALQGLRGGSTCSLRGEGQSVGVIAQSRNSQ